MPGYFLLLGEIMIEKLKKIIETHYMPIFAILAIFLCCLSIYTWSLFKTAYKANDEVKKIYNLTQRQAQDINYLQNQLQISKGTAQQLADKINHAQSGTMQPIAHITVQAPDIPTAQKVVTEKIIERDQTLPPEALQKSDKTIVAQQPSNKDYKVGIYKINLKRNWYIGTGVGYQDGKPYIPISLQRNYDRSHAITLQANISAQGKVSGGQIMWQTGF